MNWFLIAAVTIISIIFIFLGFRITGIGYYSWIAGGISIGLILLYPLVWYGVLPDLADRIVRAIVHFDMGLLGIFITFILFRDIVFVPLSVFQPELAVMAFSKLATLTILIASLLILVYGYENAANGPELKTVQVPFKDLPPALDKFSILQISDLHAGAGIDRKYVQNIVDIAIKNKPDVVVLTGDIADGDFTKYRERIAPLHDLAGKFPVLYIVGNHEYLKDSEKWLQHFGTMGFQLLLNQHTVITKGGSSILFAGVLDPTVKEVEPGEGPNIGKALAGGTAVDLKILLAHQPNIAKEASNHFDLQLSGHTHGGQFFPWNFLIKILQPYAAGLKKCGNMWVYTSVGTGYWGPPLRIGTTSEITMIKLTR